MCKRLNSNFNQKHTGHDSVEKSNTSNKKGQAYANLVAVYSEFDNSLDELRVIPILYKNVFSTNTPNITIQIFFTYFEFKRDIIIINVYLFSSDQKIQILLDFQVIHAGIEPLTLAPTSLFLNDTSY